MKTIFLLLMMVPVALIAQKNVGIGTTSPANRLHIHQDPLLSDPPSVIQLSNQVTGETSDDGMKLSIEDLDATLVNEEEGMLSMGTSGKARFNFLADGRMGYNTTDPLGLSDFMITSLNNGFGGMFVNSPDATTGRPFYGYGTADQIKAFHFYDQPSQSFKLQFEGATSTALTINNNGTFLLNAFNNVGAANLTLNCDQDGFGGIFIDSDDVTGGQPFYGYSTGEVSRAFHFFDEDDDTWKLTVGSSTPLYARDNGSVGVGIFNPIEKLEVDGAIKIGNPSTLNAANGTIMFTGADFFGRIGNVWYPLSNISLASKPSGEDFHELQEENAELLMRVEKLENTLLELQEKVSKM